MVEGLMERDVSARLRDWEGLLGWAFRGFRVILAFDGLETMNRWFCSKQSFSEFTLVRRFFVRDGVEFFLSFLKNLFLDDRCSLADLRKKF